MGREGQKEKVKIENLDKSFVVNGEPIEVLKDITLTVVEGEFVAIVGHSGCGKSTLLKIIAGLEIKDHGLLELDQRPIQGPGFDRGMVFQEHRLLPWLSVAENVALGLKNVSNEEKRELVAQYLKLVKLSAFKEAYPAQLSGGMSQRAAIARALAPAPEVLLLDEPFGALDAMTKIELQEEIKTIQKKNGTTMIMVTHDIEEAVYLADTVVVLSANPGEIRDIVRINLGRERDRGSSDFGWYRKKIFNYFFETKESVNDFMI